MVGEKIGKWEKEDLFLSRTVTSKMRSRKMRKAVLEKRESSQQLVLGRYADIHKARLDKWVTEAVSRRIWRKDGTVWVPDPEEATRTADLTGRMDWLSLPEVMSDELENLQDFSREVRDGGFSRVVLLGMGGSSLAPEVFMKTFGNRPGYPRLMVLDSTHPAAIQQVLQEIELAKTLFIVSSKSGGTIETLSFYKIFFDAVKAKKDEAGRNFVAITDPGSGLEKLARNVKFRRIFSSPPGVGGRYSALTYFGLVPAALIGVDLGSILDSGATMARACYSSVPAEQNPGLSLGAAMGELALAGRDKLTFFASPGLSPFGVWVEQLIAESTGKHGTGIVPVADEIPGAPDVYGGDRLFVYLRLSGDDNAELDQSVKRLEEGGQPFIRIQLEKKTDIGGEFFRWEMATAGAGAVLTINPFNQPDVEAAKIKARELMGVYRETGRLPADEPTLRDGGLEIFSGLHGVPHNSDDLIGRFFQQKNEGDYVALMAYIPRSSSTDEILDRIRIRLRDKLKVATTVGYGPRFLHSTGQLHKGGSNRGLFIQITSTPESDLQIPGEPYSFGTLIAAQAMGDSQALEERGRRLIRFHLSSDIVNGLKKLWEIIKETA